MAFSSAGLSPKSASRTCGKSDKPFLAWHEESASYVDGTNIPVVGEGVVAPDRIVFCGLQQENNQVCWFFTGTETESRAAQKNPNLGLGGVKAP